MISLVLVVCFVCAPLTAFASQKEQIDQLEKMLAKQDKLDTKDAAKKDREMAHKWLQEASVLVANGKREAAKKRIRRAEYAVELVTALVAAAVIRQKAEEQEASAYSAPEQVDQLKSEVEKLRQQKEDLQKELQQLKQYTQ